MAYVGVEFSENGSIGLVHSSWFTPLKHEVFWPPYKTSNSFNKALSIPEEPDQTNWKVFTIKRSFFECDDLEKARKKLKICEDTSDVYSSESNLENRKRRSRLAKRRCLSECPTSSEDEGLPEVLEIRPPVSITSNASKPLQRPPVFPEATINKPGRTSLNLTCEQNNRAANCSRISSINGNDNSCQRSEKSATKNIQVEESGTGFEKKILSTLVFIKEQNNQILSWIKKQSKTECAAVFALPEDMPVTFPLQNTDDLNQLETYMENKDNLNALCSYFSNVGGRDLVNQINNILKSILSDQVASRYSFYGKRAEKRAFCNLRLKTVVSGAVNKTVIQGTEKEIEAVIKVWLKHATDRLKIKEKRRRM